MMDSKDPTDAFDVINIDDSKMDSCLYRILQENNIYNDLHDILNENNLTMDILSKIKTNEFEELCNNLNLTIIQKAKFRVLMDLIHKTVYDEGDVDVKLKEFLDKNKLADLYYIFKRQKIDFEKLESLTTADICKVCEGNNIQIGTKIDLRNAIEKHQREILKQKYSTPGHPIYPEKVEKKEREYDKQMKIILVGDSGVGKTALFKTFIWNEYNINDHISTIGIDVGYAYQKLGNGKIVKMAIWDTGGQERFRAIPRLYYRDADAIIVCYSVDDKLSFRKCDEWLEEIEQYSQKDDVVVMLVGCKGEKKFRKDRNKNKYGKPRTVSINDGREKAQSAAWKKLGTQWGECSAKKGANVESIFMTAAELTMQRRAYQQPQREPGNRNQNSVSLVVQNQQPMQSYCDRFWSLFGW